MVCARILTLSEYFGSGPSGGNVLVPARTLRRNRLKGRCRKAAPLRIPRPLRRNCPKIFRVAMGVFVGDARIGQKAAYQKTRLRNAKPEAVSLRREFSHKIAFLFLYGTVLFCGKRQLLFWPLFCFHSSPVFPEKAGNLWRKTTQAMPAERKSRFSPKTGVLSRKTTIRREFK